MTQPEAPPTRSQCSVSEPDPGPGRRAGTVSEYQHATELEDGQLEGAPTSAKWGPGSIHVTNMTNIEYASVPLRLASASDDH